MIGGGFPRGGLILVAGNPGAGKTLFCGEFLARGAELGERGIYASFAEGREALFEYMRSAGYDFRKLERAKKVLTLDFVTMRKEGVSAILDAILEEVQRFKAKRLVIDSFTAMAQAFEQKIEARIILHTLLSKIARRLKCTTLLVSEVPIGERKVGYGTEEFVADGVIEFRQREFKGRQFREVEVLKLRGGKLQDHKHAFTLNEGFRVFHPTRISLPPEIKPWKPLKDAEDGVSTGNKDLDKILEGSVRWGSFLTLDVDFDVPFGAFSSVNASFMANFVSNGRGMFAIPSSQATSEAIREIVLPLVGDEAFHERVRAAEYGPVKAEELQPYQIQLRGKSIREDFEKISEIIEQLRGGTRQPVLRFTGFDTLEYVYGQGEPLRVLGDVITHTRTRRDVSFNLVRSAVSVIPQLRDLSDIYLKLVMVDGTVMLFGIKPRTGYHALEPDQEHGYPHYKLTPVV